LADARTSFGQRPACRACGSDRVRGVRAGDRRELRQQQSLSLLALVVEPDIAGA